MKYNNIKCAKFINRPNRFIAHVELDGKVETVHIKNTGRCKELLLPGSDVVLVKTDNSARKTQYDLSAVYKDGLGWVNIDSQAPNQAVKDWLNDSPPLFKDITYLKPEYAFGKFRVDFYLECGLRKILIEVKGCTLEIDGIGYFPDAPTERGIRHLYELAAAAAKGYECYIAFVIAMPGVRKVLPNVKLSPKFGEAFTAAIEAGVKVLYFPCSVSPDELRISGMVIGD
ncbi:MAG TPA: DNA/RNA nuclease SfsA [Clostridiales bacterium]|nr:DNA/RNA nuclease SfsA [Clostridiales bacterium]